MRTSPLEELRTAMRQNNIDVYIITSGDPHQSEYPPAYAQTRGFISGFSGSAGLIAVTQTEAYLWTDGRYHIQAKEELHSGFTLRKSDGCGDKELTDWLKCLPCGSIVGFDGYTVSYDLYNKMRRKDIRFISDIDLISKIWRGRPAPVSAPAYHHELIFQGKSHAQKLCDIRRLMEEEETDAYLIASLDDIAWLYNIRGADLLYTPVVRAYAFIDKEREYIFINDGINIEGTEKYGLDEIYNFIPRYNNPRRVLIDPAKVNMVLHALLERRGFRIIKKPDLAARLKSVKDPAELLNIRECQILDCAALTKAIIWIKENITRETLREGDIHDILFNYRKTNPNYISPSFKTIAAYMKNAAKAHYSCPASGGDIIHNNGLLLIDSGAQYLNGTTDITRTVILGDITNEMKHDFTLVLKSHIALARARWLYGCSGGHLDIIARAPMWDKGIDYKTGTGHGLSYFLNVHEGPARFARKNADAVLVPGMVLTNEPGIYREGKWGIRTENTVLVKDDYENEFGRFLSLETISYCPIDKDGILTEMLNGDEITWLESYNALVYEKLSPLLSAGEVSYLRR